jgi:hypothetical protein
MQMLRNNDFATTQRTGSPLPGTRDASGYEIFAHGEAGAAHALAHRLADTGQARLGHRLLGRWLDAHRGSGSDWVHLHFHMALFELELGGWHAALERFLSEVLPVAATTGDALTDAPALLWRIAIAAPDVVSLPWGCLRRAALSHMRHSDAPFVQVHHLLALAGAGDHAGIARWLRQATARSLEMAIVTAFAHALLALASRAYRQADVQLRTLLPNLASVGGSRAQQQLFGQLAGWAAQRARKVPTGGISLDAG